VPTSVKGGTKETYPIHIEGTVHTDSGEPEPLAMVKGGLRADRAKQYFEAGTDKEGRFTLSVDIETPPGGAERVVVWGRAIDRIMSMPLPYARVRVNVRSEGFGRSLACEANGNGEFSKTFEKEKDDGFP
jgi:hypothetical protein